MTPRPRRPRPEFQGTTMPDRIGRQHPPAWPRPRGWDAADDLEAALNRIRGPVAKGQRR